MRFGIRPARSIATALRPQVPAPIKHDSEAVPGIDSKFRRQFGVGSKAHATGSIKEDAVRSKSVLGFSPMIHVERKKKTPGSFPGVVMFHVEPG